MGPVLPGVSSSFLCGPPSEAQGKERVIVIDVIQYNSRLAHDPEDTLDNASETNHIQNGWEPEDDIVSVAGTMHIVIEPSDILVNEMETIWVLGYNSIDIAGNLVMQ